MSQLYAIRTRWIYVLLLVMLSYRWYAHSLFSQLGHTVVEYAAEDTMYHWLQDVGLFRLIAACTPVQLSLDFSLLLLPLMGLVLPVNSLIPRCCLLLFTVYILYFNFSVGHHYHGLIGMWLMILTISVDGSKHDMLWEAARYYLCFIFVSAACWKIFRGAVFDADHMQAVLQAQHAQLLSEQQLSFRSEFVRWLIQLPTVASQLLFATAATVQLSFIIGFFTRKHDSKLITLMLLFVLCNVLVMNIVSVELLVLLPFLFDRKE